ncbi:MAG: M15 family metallopeptidase [Actinobacteria bacterium]|nr:MAG: M15 family metallopeptidase [Actinomycetota bacterium]
MHSCPTRGIAVVRSRRRSCGGCGCPTGASTGGLTRVRSWSTSRLWATSCRFSVGSTLLAKDERSLEHDNTTGFNCRYAVAPGPKRWSVHAYGLAIDVDPVENPYVEGGRVHPRAGRAFLDRSHVRPGMAVWGGTLVRAFAAVGWRWGGRWTSAPDYQHFSRTGG